MVSNLIREKITAKYSQMTHETIDKLECAYSHYKKNNQQRLKKDKEKDSVLTAVAICCLRHAPRARWHRR